MCSALLPLAALHCLLISYANRLLGHDRAMAASHFIFHVAPRLRIPVSHWKFYVLFGDFMVFVIRVQSV